MSGDPNRKPATITGESSEVDSARAISDDLGSTATGIATDTSSGDSGDDEIFDELVQGLNEEVDPLEGVKLDKLSSSEAEALADKLLSSDAGWSVVYNFTAFVNAGLDPTRFVDKAMSSNQAYLVVEALDDLMRLGVKVDVDSLVNSAIKSEDFFSLTENLVILQRAGADVLDLANRLDDSSEGFPLAQNIDKFAALGISPTVLADKLISSGHTKPLAMYLPEFVKAGATIDADHLLDLLLEDGVSYGISGNLEGLLIAGANPVKLVDALVASGNSYALSDHLDLFIKSGQVSANFLAKALLHDQGTYHFGKNLALLLEAGINMELLATELIEEGSAKKLVDVIKSFSGVKIDTDKLVGQLIDSGDALYLERHLDDLFSVGTNPTNLVGMLLDAGEEFEVTQNLSKFIEAKVDPKYLVDRLAEVKYGPMRLAENIHELVGAGLDPKYLVYKLSEVGAVNYVGLGVVAFLEEGVSLSYILDIISEPAYSYTASGIIDNLKRVIELSNEFTLEDLTDKLMQMGQVDNFVYNLHSLVGLYPTPAFLLDRILTYRRLGLQKEEYQKFLDAGVQAPFMIDKMLGKDLAEAIPRNLELFIRDGLTMKDIVDKLIHHEGGPQIIRSNLNTFLNKQYGLDPTVLYEKILFAGIEEDDNPFEFLANNLQTFLDAGATIDVNKLIAGMPGNMMPSYVVPNLQTFLDAGATIDVNKLFGDLIKDVHSNLAIRHLQTFLDAGATIDVNKLFGDICKDGNARNRIGQSWPVFLNNGVNPLELRILLGQDNLRERFMEKLDEALFDDPLVKKFISTFSTSGEHLSAQLLNDVYRPVASGINPSDIPFIKALALEFPDGVSPKEVYIACSRRLREITAGILSGDLDESLRGIFKGELDAAESEKITDILIERLRLKRGEWSMDISSGDIVKMVNSDLDAKEAGSLRSRLETIQVDLLNEQALESIKFNVTTASEEEVKLLVEALNNAEAVKGSPEEFMKFISHSIDIVLAELRAKKDLIISNEKIPAGKKVEQVEAIELIIAKLTKEDGQIVEATLANIGEIVQVVSNVKLSSKEDHSLLRQNLISFLSLPLLNGTALNIPDGVRYLMANLNLEDQRGQNPQDENDSYSLTEDDLKSINEFIGHVLGQEFWTKIVSVKGKEVIRAMSKVLSAPSVADNLKAWESVKKSSQSDAEQAEKKTIKVLTTNSLIARATAGAMGDACYSRVGSIVPESADTCVLLGEDDEILGSFLVLKGLDDSGRPIHMIRALNPLESTLKKVSASSITKEIFDLVSRSAQEAGATAAVVIDDASNQATTNRPSILTEVSKKKGAGGKVSTHDNSLIFNGYRETPSRVYRI